MDVFFALAGDESTASTRYRVLNYLPALTDVGIQYDTISTKKYKNAIPGPNSIGYGVFTFELILKSPQYDILFLQKVPLPGPFIKILSNLYSNIIYDFDDALYAAPPWKTQESEWKSFLDQTLQHSSVVLTGNPVLSDYVRKFNENIVCIPTTLPVDTYLEKKAQKSNSVTETVTLGWVGNPQNLHYLTKIETTLEQVLDTNENIEFHIITAGDLPVTPLRKRSDVTYKPWTIENELDLLENVDIGLRPLSDDEWTRAKGGYTSVVQMMALGIPVVVTPVGMITDIVEHGHTGYHASSPEEWNRYISDLVEHKRRRVSFGENAYEAVGKKQFWTEQRTGEWVNIFEEFRYKS